MITYSGIYVTREVGAPCIRDIAVQGSRIVRFGGAGNRFWPVTLHSLLVADLVGEDIQHHAMLHDASEVVVGEIPRPFKTDEQKSLECRVQARLYDLLGLSLPTAKEADEIHAADMLACHVEGTLGCGPRGYVQTQPNYSFNELAGYRLTHYLDTFRPEDMLDADGSLPIYFEVRLLKLLRVVRSGSACEYTERA